jgi:hypothetical protein
LKLLLDFVTDRAAVTDAFEQALSAGDTWLSAAGLPIIQLLLENGASGKPLDRALIIAIENCEIVPESAEFVDILLGFQASVDYQDGQALKSAVRLGSPVLVEKMLSHAPSEKNILMAFSYILTSELTEDTALELIELFSKVPGVLTDLDDSRKRCEPVTFSCLKRWPRGTKVPEYLFRVGVRVDRTIPYVIESEDGLEHVSLLLWAMLQPQQKISSYVIECLLRNGGKPRRSQGILHIILTQLPLQRIQTFNQVGLSRRLS